MAKKKGSTPKKIIKKKSLPVVTARDKEKERRNKKCLKVCKLIESGLSVRASIDEIKPFSSSTLYKWIDEDANNAKHFARVCSDRQEMLFEECLKIADQDEDDKKVWGSAMIQRSKLRIQTRLDMLARMNPKKYSERHIIEGGETPIEVVTIFKLPDNGRE
jgi:hypothetical protein